MVIRKKDIKTHSRMSKRIATTHETPTIVVDEKDRHIVKKPKKGRRFLGISLVVIILLLLGWFGVKLAVSGWHVSQENFLKDLFSFGTVSLIGENEGRVNIVLMGIPGEGDDGPYLTDTVIVASLSTAITTDAFANVTSETSKTGINFLFSIPRDLYVKIPGYGNSKINAVYEIGDNKENEGGGKLVTQIVGEVLGLTTSYYVKINFSGFEKLINELGGITIMVDKDLYDNKYPAPNSGYQVVDIKAGTYTMDGAMALKYARSRQSTSDFDRAHRQQKVIMAVKNKLSELDFLSNPAKIIALTEIIANNFETNLKLTEMKRLVTLFKDIDVTQMVTKVFDDSPTGLLYGTKIDEIYVLRPTGDDFKIISDYVTKLLSGTIPTEQQSIKDPLKVEVLNGTNITGLAKRIATQLEKDGYKIITIGNNTVKGFTKTIVYDLSGGDKLWEVRRLAESLRAEVGTDKIEATIGGALARVVLGSDADAS